MSRERSDAELVAETRHSGAPAAFEALVLRHRRGILRLVLSVLGPELQADAEDVVQLVFLRAHDRLGGFRGNSRFGTWIHRIAYNLSLDYKRTRQRRRRLLRDGPLGAAARSQDAGRVDPGPQAPEIEQARSVRRALSKIPDPYQTALRLHYWLDLPIVEIAETMGVAAGTVKSYLHRGRSRLHRVLQDEEMMP